MSKVGCLTFRDITASRQAHDRLTYVARHDVLTGALSRAALLEHLAALTEAKTPLTLLLFDLTRFRTINETLGFAYGDQVLRAAVSRLINPTISAIARLGGDSFAVVFPNALDDEAIKHTCRDLIASLAAPYAFDGRSAIVGVSIGVTTSALSQAEPHLMLSHADIAHSAAKTIVGNGFVVFDPAMDVRLQTKRELELALRYGIANNELSVAYQPQVSLATGELVGVEALVRWTMPGGRTVSPADFIPIAEETGLIVELGQWVLDTACKEAAAWPSNIKLAVNFSPIQFELTDVVETVSEALASSGLNPRRLDIEITEGIFLAGSARIEAMLAGVRQLGVGVALDDFGTGYSSLGYLGRLPIDKIKIDQSFVRKLPLDSEAMAVIHAVVALALALKKVIVVEGVENDQQAGLLRKMGCEIAQGFYFGKPMLPAEFDKWLGERDRQDRKAG